MLTSKGSFRVRSSKFRHIYGESLKKELWYENVQPGKSANEGTICSVNPQFLAVAVSANGGSAFIVHPLSATGRVDSHAPKFLGHKDSVVDLKFNPFQDHLIASASDDATVRVWRIPPSGALRNITSCLLELRAHNRRVSQIEWHPSAANVLVSIGQDNGVNVWDVERAQQISAIRCHSEAVYSVAWNRDGSLIGTTSRDRLLRIIDPRTGACAQSFECHASSKSSRVCFVDDRTLLSTGVSRSSDREFAIWQLQSRDPTRALARESIDASNGILLPFYDADLRLLFLAGKGDGNIRFYELTDEMPHYHAVGQYLANTPQQAIGAMPKRGLDFHRCEIMRFYKLLASGGICEPISIIVPRRFGSDTLQGDIYPPFAAPRPALTAAEWISGVNRSPVLLRVRDLLDGRQTEPEPVAEIQPSPSLLTVVAPAIASGNEKQLNVQQPMKPVDMSLSARARVTPPESENLQQPASPPVVSPAMKRSAVTVTISPSQRVVAQKPAVHEASVDSKPVSDTVTLSTTTVARPKNRESSSDLHSGDANNINIKVERAKLEHPRPNGNGGEGNASADADNNGNLPPVAAFIRNSPFYASLNTNVTSRSYRAVPAQQRTRAEPVKVTEAEEPAQLPFNVRLRATQSRANGEINRASATNRYSMIPLTTTTDTFLAAPSQVGGAHSRSWTDTGLYEDQENAGTESEPRNEAELRKAYSAQCDRIRRLEEELASRDVRISELETKLRALERQTTPDGAETARMYGQASSRVLNVKRASVNTSEV